jgi:hypothetical protein
MPFYIQHKDDYNNRVSEAYCAVREPGTNFSKLDFGLKVCGPSFTLEFRKMLVDKCVGSG